ncbi:chorismate mutase [Cohnella lubricantis]|uniref:chorismate mutase n=1 Tax=Cohnella lubricantis TaxID=2163172 RepID=A0A841TC91_9BACL|nr:chorismate mutase [Cohnella lubricantis]MBB6677756.1 chorismate mutase [Cohnella lubricantis]MBP2117718.1 chorismate mutase [Cohnella lubricantis]
MSVRGIRGAITVQANDRQQIWDASVKLMNAVVEVNGIEPEEICSVMITVTQDLDAAFPAKAIRELSGWDYVPLMCSVEIPVKGSLERCIRFLVHVNTDLKQSDMRHVYLGGAEALRPDLAAGR